MATDIDRVGNEMPVERIYEGAKWVMALLAGIWGGVPELTQLLLMLMVIDIALGVAVAVRNETFSPSVAWRGVSVKIYSLIVIAVLALLNPHVQDVVEVNLVQAGSAFYLVPELGSIIRNAHTLEVPIPRQLNNIVEYFRTMSGGYKANKTEDQLPNEPEDK